MESIIFNAARDGDLYELELSLDYKPKEEVTKLISFRTNGSTPLLMACRNGHSAVASYLVEKCQADVEQIGSVTFDDGESLADVSPLWCAAACGHLNLVKFLVRNKASVNYTTKNNCTPLRTACFEGHFDVVKYLIQHGADIEIADRKGDTCLMIACYKGHYEISKYLVECGADVNRKSMDGNTALHELGSLEILKFLLKNGANHDCNFFGITPLLKAAEFCRKIIVEYFIQELECTKQEKVNALELLGASFVDEKQDVIMALGCWKRAMKLHSDDGKHLLQKPRTLSPLSSYVDVTEVQTFEQLEELISDPDGMRIQALLVRERIHGPDHPHNLYYIRKRGATYADDGDFDRCIQLWMYVLDVQQKLNEALSSKTQNILLLLSDVFSRLMSSDRRFPLVSFRNILNLFERTVKEIAMAIKLPEEQLLNDTSQFYLHRTLIIALKLVNFMCSFPTVLKKCEELELKKAVYQFVRMNPRTKAGFTPLHLACFETNSTLSPLLEVVDLLLEVGADPNAVDACNNTPLHLLAKQGPLINIINLTAFQSLLDHGAHPDLCNSDRQTPQHLFQATRPGYSISLDVYPLQCLSARAVRKHSIPYKGVVDERLEVFVDGH